MTERELHELLNKIEPADAGAMDAAKKRQAELAKPPGSLGALEDYAVRLAGITGKLCPEIEKCRVIVLAADNGVVCEGVSCTPQSVTAQQCINMTRHKTGMSALAGYFGDEIAVVDVGVAAELPTPVLNRKIRLGTADLLREPAMTREEALRAIETGLELARQAAREGVSCVGVGEMGIGNTTTSTLVLSCLTGLSPDELTGRGGGLTDEGFRRKKEVIRRALELQRPDGSDVIGVLSKVGGLDLAAMCGVFLGCAEQKIPAVVDGFISITAALCAVRLCPQAKDFMFLSHASFEIGYRKAAQELGLEPCLQLGMRLGEGSGCPIMFRILQAACAAHGNMATFSEAAINDNYLTPIRKGNAYEVKS